jgi:predicted nuclease with TOPRIM domain
MAKKQTAKSNVEKPKTKNSNNKINNTAKKESVSVSEYESLKLELKAVTAEKQAMQEAIELIQSERNDLIDKVDNSVPKEKLRNETWKERLQWFYKDLNPNQRIIANIILVIFGLGLIASAVYTYIKFGSDSEIFDMITQIIFALVGVTGAGSIGLTAFLRTPKKQ